MTTGRIQNLEQFYDWYGIKGASVIIRDLVNYTNMKKITPDGAKLLLELAEDLETALRKDRDKICNR